MNETIAKCVGVKYPRSTSVPGTKSDVISFVDKNIIQSTIKEMLFIDRYDYIIIFYNKELHICEKNTETTYSRREILYHPLGNELIF